MRRWHDARGQASSEYVALVALVAVALSLAAGLSAGGVGGELLAGLQRGLCRVADVRCPRAQPARDVLDPCPMERTTSAESLEGALELVELGGSRTLTTVRLSDGRVVVTLAEGQELGGGIGLGYALRLGHRVGAGATAGFDVRASAGRSWTLPNAGAARAFIARHGAKATIGGKAVDVVRGGCSILCDALGWRPHAALPPADETTLDWGAAARLGGSLGLAGLRASDGRVLGARLLRGGGSTWHVEYDARAAATLLSSARLAAAAERRVVVSYTLDARQRPLRMTLETVARTDASAALHAAGGRLSAHAGGTVARVVEQEATLDLRDARNRVAATALLAAREKPFDVRELRRRLAAAGRRIARAGVVHRRVYALSSSAFALGGELALVGRLGAGFERTHEGMRLLSARTRLPGLPFLPRDDCRPRR